ncbi:unnamed protein product [Mytilus coruscus]|uniref:DNA-directed DNA polymerase n=1 Tax=Mytilus coruscus TaxID=42192 RepID=A0A6J8A0E9_MYTCO|nr:unnamed protein product [Mytilus coruscus]
MKQTEITFLYLIDSDEYEHFAAIVSITGFFSCNNFCTNCLKPYSHKHTHSCKTTCTVYCSSNCILTDSTLSCRACNRTCRSIACFYRLIEEKKTKKGLSYRERIFRGEYAIDAFCRRVFTEQYKNGVVLSHNGSGYDNYFLIDWLISNSIRPDIIFNGTQIMYMVVGRGLNIRVLDSLNFLPMKLSKIPKAFGLKELKKGYFPHFFNTMDNQNYIGPYPDIKYYGCDYMNKDDRKDFLTCDTTILREGVLRFRDLMLEVTGTEKMENTHRQSVYVLDYASIASMCMGIYKTNFLKEQYDVEVKTQDTDHIEMKSMQSTQKGFDVWDRDTWKSFVIFLSENPQRSFGQRKFVRSPLAHVPTEGYTKRYNHSRSSILWFEWMMNEGNVFIQHALNCRKFKIPGTKFHVDGYCQETNAVFEFLGGGRTDTTKLYHKAENDEKIKNADCTSLYPWTNKYCRYPLHHPEIIPNNFEDLDKYFGLCKVKILPPRNLYHAVLPYRCHGKLTFPLCRTCVETKNQDNTQYDKKTNSGGLLADYVQMFLKFKQEASGFHPYCTLEEEKREYVRLYKENEGIDFDYDNIKVSPGLRSLAKLCLNSFWGKFGQWLFLKRHSFFHESEADKFFQKLVSDPTKVVENFQIVSNDAIQLEWTQHFKSPLWM